jgi:hypothetical protein
MTDSLKALAPGETIKQWDRRRRDRLRVRPEDVDPLAGLVAIGQHRVYPDDDKRGSMRRGPRRVVEYDILARKEGLNVVAYRGPDGAVEYVNTSSTPTDSVLSSQEVEPKLPEPGGKRTDKILDRGLLEPKRETVYDDDGTERVVVHRVSKGY